MNTAKISGDVINIQQDGKIRINRGTLDGVEKGQWYLIYKKGEDVTDPETGKYMLSLELIRGYGEVRQVENREAVLMMEPAYKERDSISDWHVRRVAGKPALLWPPKFWQ